MNHAAATPESAVAQAAAVRELRVISAALSEAAPARALLQALERHATWLACLTGCPRAAAAEYAFRRFHTLLIAGLPSEPEFLRVAAAAVMDLIGEHS